MSKNETSTAKKANTKPALAKTEAVEGEAKKGGKKVMLTVKGKEVSRVDYIRSRWADKASRSEITKEVCELQGKEVPYQIIFAATKGIAGGPDKVAKDDAAE